MTEQAKKVVLPAYLMRRFEAFRVPQGSEYGYLVRDKALGKTYDFEPWQFFVLEVLPGCEDLPKLQTIFSDRFNRELGRQELDAFFASIAERKMFDESAASHPLLAPFFRKTYAVDDGRAVPRPFTGQVAAQPEPEAAAGAAGPAVASLTPAAVEAAPAPAPPPTAAVADSATLAAGIQDAVGFDWRATRWMFDLFDPRPLLRVLSPVVAPLRHVVYVVPLLLLVALALAFEYAPQLFDALKRTHWNFNLAEHLVFALLTINVMVTLSTAFVAHHYRVAVRAIGITLYFSFIPRFVTRMAHTEQLTRRETMWLQSAGLIMRMVLFSLGMLTWYASRDDGGSLSSVALAISLTCAVGLLFESGNPLVKGNGYFLLSSYLNEPRLRGKAFRALLSKLRGDVYQAADGNLLAAYALASMTYVLLVIVVISMLLERWLYRQLDLGGSAILIAGALALYLLHRNYVGLKKFGDAYDRALQFDRWRQRTVPVAAADAEGKASRRTGYWSKALLLCLLVALFLPYPYEPGGKFVIFPERKQVLSTDTPGLVEEVFFSGGESVKKGVVIARLAHTDYQAQVKVLEARLAEQRAVVDDLKARPKPEEVKVAQQALQVAKTRESFSAARSPRLETLFRDGAVSFEEFDAARKDHQVDLQQVAEKQAALALAKTGSTAEQIAAAEARWDALKAEQDAMADKVTRTVLRMPFDGNILTLHLKDRINSYLDKGQPFASIESTSVVTAEIEVTEAELQYVKVGSAVRARPISYSDTVFEGEVSLIDRNVTTQPFGNVVKVIAQIRNDDAALKTGMTGHAKIAGTTMPVWKAFSLAIVRFVNVQLWSWIP